MEFKLIDYSNVPQTDCLIIAIFENGIFSATASKIDQISNGYLSHLYQMGDLNGKIGQTTLLHQVPNINAKRLLVVGCGQKQSLTVRQYKKIIQKSIESLAETGTIDAICYLTELTISERDQYWNVRFAVETIQTYYYRYDVFKTQTPPHLIKLKTVTFAVSDITLTTQAITQGQAVSFGIKNAKDIANCPPNVCTPKYLADLAIQLATEYPQISTQIIDEAKMAELGMNAYLAVSSGSANSAFMSVIEYRNHPDKASPPIVLIGKGLTFDTGGISIKPAEGMDEMKYDMAGAAAVYGTIKAIAELQLPLNIVAILAGCENMPDGNAYRPGDILTTLSGLTVEVLNTDAEGRLVLCDVLSYVNRFNPKLVIDVATLTGACIIALGHHTSGLFSSNDTLANALLKAAEESDDQAWRLPMGEQYQEQLKSNFADLANIGGRFGGAITAGQFLSNFTQQYDWAHLDVAGTAWQSGANKGATGRPTALLVQFLMNQIKP